MPDYIEELRKTFRIFKYDGDNVRVGPCPKCSSRRALSVNIHGSKVPPGTFHCWHCGWSGSWNRLAKRYGMAKADKDQLTEEANRLLRKQKESLKKAKTPQQFEMRPWSGGWRGISEELLLSLDAKLWLDTTFKKDKPIMLTHRLFLPVTKYGEEVGYIAAIRYKKDRKDQFGNDRTDKYKNSPGEWAKHILWPMDFIGECKVVCLVEGPYDLLKLLDYGIPALCFLGVQNWQSGKSSILASSGVEIVIPLTDNDEAGEVCKDRIYQDLEDQFDVRDFPYTSKDPGCMSKSELKLLAKYVNRLEKELA